MTKHKDTIRNREKSLIAQASVIKLIQTKQIVPGIAYSSSLLRELIYQHTRAMLSATLFGRAMKYLIRKGVLSKEIYSFYQVTPEAMSQLQKEFIK